jgi:predicted RecB family endonuclease
MGVPEDVLTAEQRLAVREIVEACLHGRYPTREDFSELKMVVADLAQAQVRTEKRVEQLALAQEQLALAQEELAQAQRKTEKAVQELARQVGSLSENLGGNLEDLSYQVVPYVLEKELGLEFPELGREFLTIDGKEMEFNIYGKGVYRERPEQEVVLLGEVKTNITAREMTRFARQVERARVYLPGVEIIPLFFGFRARPAVRQLAQELGIRLVFSYGKLL